jgi:hypothetical protein
MMHPALRLIRAASWLVPSAVREDWLCEWEAEFAYVRHVLERRETSRKLWRFAFGSFKDALWSKRNHIEWDRPGYRRRDSPRFCLSLLLLLVAAVCVASLGLPVTRAVITPLPYANADRIATIAQGGIPVSVRSSIKREWVRLWRHESRTIQDLATYIWKKTDHAHREPVLEAQVSPNFFELLGARTDHGHLFQSSSIKIAQNGVRRDELLTCPGSARRTLCASDAENGVVLSYDFFERASRDHWINADQSINLGGRNYPVIGVLEKGFWFLSRDIGVWAIDDSSSARTGVVARIRADSTKESVEAEFISILQNAGLEGWNSLIDVSMVQQRVRDVFISFGFGVGMAAIITGVALRFRIALFEKGGLLQAAFFCAKTGLALLAVLLVGLEFTHAPAITMTGGTDLWAEPLSTWLFLMTSMGVLAWSMLDQRRRCRVCLRKLGLAAHVGCPGCLLLNWAGTELVCMDGHGMLHVPEMNASWNEPERWTELDESWVGLFARR